MKRAYFITIRLDSGEWVDLVYESSHRKGTGRHYDDLYYSARKAGVGSAVLQYSVSDLAVFSYILNEKNKHDQCFDDYRVVDLRA